MGDPFLVDKPITAGDVVFTKATPELQQLSWRLNGVSWAAPMDIDKYIARETHLSQQELSRDGRNIYWVLHPKGDPSTIVASCESVKKTVFIAGRGSGGFTEASGYAIASVYTNPEYRRLGMASYMLRQLQEYMDTDSECSALYSDIGKVYYASLGWPVFPSDQATIHLETDKFAVPDPPGTRHLSLDELEPLCDKDVDALMAKMKTLAGDEEKLHVAFAPSFSQVSWQLAREAFMAEAMFNKKIERRGAITNDGKSWIYWDHDWREKKLKILRIVTSESSTEEEKTWHTMELLRAAVAEAMGWGLPKVLVWNPDATTTRGIKGLSNFHENEVKIIFDERTDGSIPCFRWKGGKSVKDTVWEENHYFCWC